MEYGDIGTGFVIGGIVFILAILLVFSILMAIANYKLYQKMGEEGWVSLIPIYNMWVLLEKIGLPGWIILIPGANMVVTLIAYYKLSEFFGKSSSFGIGLVMFPIIFIPILAFDNEIKAAQ